MFADMIEYENSLKNQPLYMGRFFANSDEKAAYLQAPEWVSKWMAELDKIYLTPLSKVA